MGLFGSSTTNSVDPKTGKYIEDYRSAVQKYSGNILNGFQPGGPHFGAADISNYQNPFEAQVIGGMQSDFDRQRALAAQGGADQAIGAHAYGGSRSGILQAGLVNGVNQNEASALANLRYGGFNNALGQLNQDRQFGLAQQGQALGAWAPGMTPISQTQSTSGSIVGGILGLGSMAAGMIPGIGKGLNVLKGLGGGGGQPGAGGPFGGGYNGAAGPGQEYQGYQYQTPPRGY